MNFTKTFRSFLLILFTISAFSIGVSAQNALKTFNRKSDFDVQHYILRVSFEHKNRKVIGDTTVQLKPLTTGFKTVELDAVDLNFSSVTLESENKNLEFNVKNDKIFVTLDKEYSPDSVISLNFKYTANPKKGVYFVDELTEDGKIEHSDQIWTQGEPEEARHWFPAFDFPSDKATTEQYLTVKKDETAIGNGELLEEKDNGNGTKTVHYKMNVPHSTYLISFVIGKYTKISDTYNNIPLGYYVYPGKESIVPKAYGKTKEMMRIFEELTQIPFPYNKYDQTIVAKFNFGGMENITATTMADSEIFFANFEFGRAGVEDLVSHELAHSWFGDLVTCDNWAELWLNEGFATFMEAAYREKMYGRADYIRKINGDAQQFLTDDAVNKNRHGLYNQLARPDDSIFDSTTYQKGGAVIHTLRETIGDAAFWKAIGIYLNRHKFKNVQTPDLQKVMEEVSGKDLKWFFAQWVYGGGSPKIEVTQKYDLKTKTLKLFVKQNQKEDGLTASAFILPMEIEIKTAKGTKLEKVEITKREQEFSFKTDNKPTSIKFDKNDKIPLKTVKIS